MLRFDIHRKVFILHQGKIIAGKVLSRRYSEYIDEEVKPKKLVKETFYGVDISTPHGRLYKTLPAESVFASRAELIASL